MAGYRYLIASLIFLLFGCAQVGTISGGEKDITAPQPIADEVAPPNAWTNFRGNSVEIPFDEYFKLNNPRQNIRIIPPHSTLNTSVKGKKLTISWEEELQPNTTYAIYMNRAIKDLSEGNDSIMQYVFSTGNQVDSFSYTAVVTNAWTNAPEAGAIVMLYDPETEEIVNFAETDKRGIAQLNYLGKGEYTLLAFKDENDDLEAQPNELIAFPDFSESLVIDSSSYLEKPLRIFAPQREPELRTLKFLPPASFVIGANRPIENEEIYVNGERIDSTDYFFIADDSLRVFINPDTLSSGSVILKSKEVTDTSSFRISSIQKTAAIIPVINPTVIAPKDSISIEINDIISEIDTSKIVLINKEDSTRITQYTYQTDYNSLSISFDRSEMTSIGVTLENGAIIAQNGESARLIKTITLNPPRKYGNLIVDASYYTQPVIFQLLKGTQVEEELLIEDPSKEIVLNQLIPDQYIFRIILDDNGNGRWDTGDYETRRQPETIDVYSKATKVRANWDVKVELVPLSEHDDHDHEESSE